LKEGKWASMRVELERKTKRRRSNRDIETPNGGRESFYALKGNKRGTKKP